MVIFLLSDSPEVLPFGEDLGGAAAYAIIKPVRNCELKDPSISTSREYNGPFMINGSFPLFDRTETPSLGNTSSKKSMGRFNKLPEPTIVISLLLSAANGVNIRILKPLSPQLISS